MDPIGHPQGGSSMAACPIAHYPIDNQRAAEVTPEEVLPQFVMPDPPVRLCKSSAKVAGNDGLVRNVARDSSLHARKRR